MIEYHKIGSLSTAEIPPGTAEKTPFARCLSQIFLELYFVMEMVTVSEVTELPWMSVMTQ